MREMNTYGWLLVRLVIELYWWLHNELQTIQNLGIYSYSAWGEVTAAPLHNLGIRYIAMERKWPANRCIKRESQILSPRHYLNFFAPPTQEISRGALESHKHKQQSRSSDNMPSPESTWPKNHASHPAPALPTPVAKTAYDWSRHGSGRDIFLCGLIWLVQRNVVEVSRGANRRILFGTWARIGGIFVKDKFFFY